MVRTFIDFAVSKEVGDEPSGRQRSLITQTLWTSVSPYTFIKYGIRRWRMCCIQKIPALRPRIQPADASIGRTHRFMQRWYRGRARDSSKSTRNQNTSRGIAASATRMSDLR